MDRGVMKLNVDIIWNNVLKEIKEELSSLAFSTWFQDVNLKDLKDDTAIIIVPMSIHKKHLHDNYQDLIKNALNKITGTTFELEFFLENEFKEKEEAIKEKEEEEIMIQCANMPMKYQKWIIQILAYSHIGTLNHYYFSTRIRASTANKPLSVATNGFISISFISLAKRNKVERRTIMSAYCCSSMPFCPRVPLMIGYPLKERIIE